jgi:hypothetical protein
MACVHLVLVVLTVTVFLDQHSLLLSFKYGHVAGAWLPAPLQLYPREDWQG